MAPEQEAAWHGLLDLYEAHPEGWTLIGGQLVHLPCAERGFAPQRPTDDADTVVDARTTRVLGAVTASLKRIDFVPAPASADGVQHRWTRGAAVIDVLIPDGMGERAERPPWRHRPPHRRSSWWDPGAHSHPDRRGADRRPFGPRPASQSRRGVDSQGQGQARHPGCGSRAALRSWLRCSPPATCADSS